MLAALKQGKKNFEKKQQITSMLNMHSQEGEGSTHANKHWLVGWCSFGAKQEAPEHGG